LEEKEEALAEKTAALEEVAELKEKN